MKNCSSEEISKEIVILDNSLSVLKMQLESTASQNFSQEQLIQLHNKIQDATKKITFCLQEKSELAVLVNIPRDEVQVNHQQIPVQQIPEVEEKINQNPPKPEQPQPPLKTVPTNNNGQTMTVPAKEQTNNSWFQENIHFVAPAGAAIFVLLFLIAVLMTMKKTNKQDKLDNTNLTSPTDGNKQPPVILPTKSQKKNTPSTASTQSKHKTMAKEQSTQAPKPSEPKVKQIKSTKPTKPKPSISEIAKHTAKPKRVASQPKAQPIVFHSNEQASWFLLAHSEIGAGHIKHNLPCQDRHFVNAIEGTEWGVAVVCDGLGSKSHSDQGADFVSKTVADKLKGHIEKEQWISKNLLPNDKHWQQITLEILYSTYKDLFDFSEKNKLPLNQLGCTVIAVIYSPLGLLITHIGDGRAGYCDMSGGWHAMMSPFNGEYSNQVVAITSNIWTSATTASQYISSHIINQPVQAFCLMSDGCESFAYETAQWDDENNTCKMINKPADVFFNPVIEYVRKNQQTASDNWQESVNASWKQLLTNGTPLIAQEPDDKTIVLGMLINS